MLYHKFIGNSESDELIIFVHQGLGCTEMWEWYPIQLCKGLKIKGLLYDRKGFGKSGNVVPERDIDFLHKGADELEELIETHLDAEQNFSLYGHSEGGSIALIYASRFPHRVKKIVTEAAHGFVENNTTEGIAKVLDPYQSGKLDGLEKYHGSKFREVFMAWYKIWMDPKFRDWSIFEELQKNDSPALFMHGESDQYGSTSQLDKISEHYNGPHQLYKIPDCGHFPFQDQTNFVMEKATDFLNEL